jgi:hypothetical protein
MQVSSDFGTMSEASGSLGIWKVLELKLRTLGRYPKLSLLIPSMLLIVAILFLHLPGLQRGWE